MPRLYGWRKDRPDDRDWKSAALLGAAPAPPESATLRPRILGPVLDQVRSDCTANAVARALQIARTPTGGPSAPLPSRNWLYYQSGVPEGSQHADNGRYLRDVFAPAALVGVPPEGTWPYDQHWDQHPATEAYRQAHAFRAHIGVEYARIDSVGSQWRFEVSQAIAAGYPVVVGATVTEGWERQDGVVPFQPASSSDPIAGGHAFALVEYDPGGPVPLNSWGDDWAASGYGYVSWDWCYQAIQDTWIVRVS